MNQSDLLPRRRCEEVLSAAQAEAFKHGIRDVEVHFHASNESLTRFANNHIHQNVSERSVTASFRVAVDSRTARASTNRLTREGIQSAIDEAVALARAGDPIPDLPPMFESSSKADGSRFSEACANCTPAERAAGVAEAIRVVHSNGQIAAGIYATTESVESILNSRGVFHYYFDTLTTFSITAMAEDSSGWAKASSTQHEEIHPADLARRASRKAKLSAKPREISPGAYTVILEPAAVLDLVGQMFFDFSATSLADKRSFLMDRTGQKLFGSNITIYDDVHFPLQAGAPFDGEGVPRRSLTLVKHGSIAEIPYCRSMAARQGVDPTGHGFPLPNDQGEAPVNIVIVGGKTCIDDMIASTKNGVLVTRVWYVRETEPYEKLLTGMTRDGTFLIRDGEIAAGIRNLRFNESLIRMLSNVESLSPSTRASGEESFDMVVPAMKVNDFTFTEVTEY